jgi:UPF0755 protein
MIKRVMVGVLVVSVLGVGTVSYAVLHNPAKGAPVEVDVPPGATTSGIADLLTRDGVIGNRLAFRILSKLRGLDGRIEAGRYKMWKHMGIDAALDVLAKPPIEKGTPVTIPPGFTMREIAARVGAKTHISVNDFLAAAKRNALPPIAQSADISNAEGFLFPETYLVGDTESADQLVRRMFDEFQARTAGLAWDAADGLKMTHYQIVIVASLIEREAKVPEDRAKVAAVIYNRLRKHMRLQIDATAIYGIPHKVPTLADLRRPSPYNTYLIDGLPPAPIASPGLASLDAALHPAPIDALYYVVCEPSGQSCFTDSASEFEKLKARRPAGTH